jgi:hypothetical protein
MMTMRNQRHLASGLLVAVLASSAASASRAGSIPVVNASFEEPSYAPNGFGPATGWVSSGPGGGGAFHPVIGTSVNSVPDGVQVGYAGDFSNAGALFQDLGVGVVDGATYDLTLYVGSRKEGTDATYLIELLAGGSTIGSVSGEVSTGTGDFFTVSLTATGAGSGDLGIRLSQVGPGQTLFDELQLTASAVPEPSGLVMLSAGPLVLLMGYGWRRRRRSAV